VTETLTPPASYMTGSAWHNQEANVSK